MVVPSLSDSESDFSGDCWLMYFNFISSDDIVFTCKVLLSSSFFFILFLCLGEFWKPRFHIYRWTCMHECWYGCALLMDSSSFCYIKLWIRFISCGYKFFWPSLMIKALVRQGNKWTFFYKIKNNKSLI